MGRNYFCDFCQNRMKDDVRIRQKHNAGLVHKIIKAEHDQQFRDPKVVLEEELRKTPCPRYFNGKLCKYGITCHFSHYTPQQIEKLKAMVINPEKFKRKPRKKKKKEQPTEESGNFSWRYPEKAQQTWNLPPSLYPIHNIEGPVRSNDEWGA